MASVWRFVAENRSWFTGIFLVGAALMVIGWLVAWWDWRRKRGTLLEDWAAVQMWRYASAAVFFLLLVGGVQLIAHAAPDGHFVLARLWAPEAHPVVTPTPTPTPIPVPNLIPTPTPTVTPTPTPLPTPTATPTPTPSPIPTLGPGGKARVDAETLNVRAQPSTKAERVGVLLQGETVDVLGGPKEANGYRWWQVKSAKGITGWVAEGTDEVQWLVPIP